MQNLIYSENQNNPDEFFFFMEVEEANTNWQLASDIL